MNHTENSFVKDDSLTKSDVRLSNITRSMKKPCLLYRIEGRLFSDTLGTVAYDEGYWKCELDDEDRVRSVFTSVVCFRRC